MVPVTGDPTDAATHINPSDTRYMILIGQLAATCIHTLISVTVSTTTDLHIGLSDTPYTHLDASVATQFSNCTSMWDPLTYYADVERQCQSGISGRYVYVYTEVLSGHSSLGIFELEAYGAPAVVASMCLYSNKVQFMVLLTS